MATDLLVDFLPRYLFPQGYWNVVQEWNWDCEQDSILFCSFLQVLLQECRPPPPQHFMVVYIIQFTI